MFRSPAANVSAPCVFASIPSADKLCAPTAVNIAQKAITHRSTIPARHSKFFYAAPSLTLRRLVFGAFKQLVVRAEPYKFGTVSCQIGARKIEFTRNAAPVYQLPRARLHRIEFDFIRIKTHVITVCIPTVYRITD